MKTHIFIRTFRGDAEWLNYCLRSIKKFTSGFSGLTTVCPAQDVNIIGTVTSSVGFDGPIAAKEHLEDQYIEQQITKVYADTYLPKDTDIIMFLDSDCTLTALVTPNTYLVDGKIRLIRESFERMRGDQCYCWKAITQKALGLDNVEYEGMRTHPFLFYPETLRRVRKWFLDVHKISVEDYAKQQPLRQFSEFNIINTVAQLVYADKYFIHTIPEDGMPITHIHQSWSRGGISPEHKEWIEKLLND